MSHNPRRRAESQATLPFQSLIILSASAIRLVGRTEFRTPRVVLGADLHIHRQFPADLQPFISRGLGFPSSCPEPAGPRSCPAVAAAGTPETIASAAPRSPAPAPE